MKKLALGLMLLLLFTGLVAADEGGGEKEGEAELGGLAAFGVGLVFVGVAYYSLTKRGLIIEHRRGSPGIVMRPERAYITVFGPVYPMTIHHSLTVVGTLLALAHFVTCTDYSTLGGKAGLGMAIVLVLMNISGFYGRYVHVKIEMAARKKQSERLKRFAVLLRRWKLFHIALAVLFLILLGIHLAVVGD
ncbi:hypothetical protein [Thermococcus stetteri]|uniref:hypothetical protein n=1 Tax=Thermococcus stetteri TaxID=49900 RepID=UPI001AE618D5|nr:hypothetical protein [Thermococcus stetteri]MBP1912791.1 hypothetical protein [Thermococcus stetteri]